MKIAAITDNGNTISQHFGRAAYYLVMTIENGQIIERELRNKLGHSHFVNQSHHSEDTSQGHGMDPASHNKHIQMAASIADCDVLLCGGMGRGAYQSMLMQGITPVVTEIRDIEPAVKAFLDGEIVDRVEWLH